MCLPIVALLRASADQPLSLRLSFSGSSEGSPKEADGRLVAFVMVPSDDVAAAAAAAAARASFCFRT